jgi:Tfp pilus assembly protein PilN
VRAINLLPKDDGRSRRQKPPSALVLTGVIGGVVVTALTCGMLVLSHGKVQSKQAELDGLRQELGAIPVPAQAQVARSDALVADKQKRITALNAALSRRVAWDRVLREFSMILPDDVWLVKISGKPPTLSTDQNAAPAPGASSTTSAASGVPQPPGQATDGDSLFAAEGYTYSQNGVARLMARMAVVPDFEHIQLLFSERAVLSGRSIYHFSVGADVRSPGGGA